MRSGPTFDAIARVTTGALAVVAHPDDESFGLGAILSELTRRGVPTRVLCFTRGEASTLGDQPDLAAVRAEELKAAGRELGVREVTLLDYPDGGLSAVSRADLIEQIEARVGRDDLLVVFEPGGVTGHADHIAATAAASAVAARKGLALLEWGVRGEVAEKLNSEFGTTFVSLEGVDVEVDRRTQWLAIHRHTSQSHTNPVMRRRIELSGPRERMRHAPPSYS